MLRFFAALMAVFFVSTAHADQALIDRISATSPSVGALYKNHDDGSLQFLCSITAIDNHEGETVLITAFHCVTRGVSYKVTFDRETYHSARVWKIPGYAADKDKYPRAYHEPEVDMAFFKTRADVPVVKLADPARQKAGRDIVMVGFPLGQAKVAYKGIVSGYFDRPGDDTDGYQLLQIFGAPGSSGSSVIDPVTGEIISILVSAKQARAGLPVIFATPIDYAKYLRPVPTGKEKEVGQE